MKKDNNRVLVTGGAGFVGAHLSTKLAEIGLQVFVVDDLSKGNLKYVPKKAQFSEVDITTPKFKKIVKSIKPDYIFHLAAQTSIAKSLKNPAFDFKVNLLATENLLQATRGLKIKKIIFASSAAVYGEISKFPIQEEYPKNPISIYGVTKLCCEYLLQINFINFKIPYVCLRFANVYGENQDPSLEGGVVAIFMDKIIKKQPVTIFGDGNQTRDFISVEDVVDACMKSRDANVIGEFNVGSGRETTINKLLGILKEIASVNIPQSYEQKPFPEVTRSALSFKKLKRETGWKPHFNLEAGLIRTFEYLRKYN